MQSFKVLVVLVAEALGVVIGMAQSVTAESTALFTVPTLIRLVVNVDTIDFETLTLADYDQGYKDALDAQVVSVWSNRTWVLSVAPKSAVWSGPWEKPASDLQLKVASVSKPGRVTSYLDTLTGLTTDDLLIAEGSPGGNIQHTMDFRVLVNWDNDVAGDYSLGFTYTLTVP